MLPVLSSLHVPIMAYRMTQFRRFSPWAHKISANGFARPQIFTSSSGYPYTGYIYLTPPTYTYQEGCLGSWYTYGKPTPIFPNVTGSFPVGQGFLGMSEPMKELMRLVKGGELNTGGNPVARWNADSVEVKRDDAENIKPVR